MNTTPKPKVRVIPASKSLLNNVREYKKLRVCAYGRVSTDSEEQMSSIKAQKSYFMDKILANPEWDFAGYYEDEGISGKSVEKRLGFQKMIKDCEAGKIDVILTKTVSRFSRNTVDSITYARTLKEMGVEVRFDQDGFGMFDDDAEMRLTIMAMIAQEEIIKQSRSIKFGQREKARQGKVSYNFTNWYGYEEGPDKQPLIVPEEALIVEQIYTNYISGESMTTIAKELNAKSLSTKLKKKWSSVAIQRILTDHKYCGNYLFGKTYKADPLSRKVVKNTGQSVQYLIEEAHTGIVTTEMFYLAQAEIKRRNDIKIEIDGVEKLSKYNSKYALSEKMYCVKCKSNVGRKVWKRRSGELRPMWVCRARTVKTTHKCTADAVDEFRIHEAVMRAVNQLTYDRYKILDIIQDSVCNAISSEKAGVNPMTLKNEITMLEKSFSELLSLSVKSKQPELFEERFKKIADDIETKKKQYDEAERLVATQDDVQEKIEETMDFLMNAPQEFTEYDDYIVRQVVKRIGLIDVDNIKVVFMDDTEMEVTMMAKV